MRQLNILFFSLLFFKVCSLYAAEDALSEHVLLPDSLTSCVMRDLYNGRTILHNGNVAIKAKDLDTFKNVFPRGWQLKSQYDFISRISSVKEKLISETVDSKNLEAEFSVAQDTLGYGPFTFTLLLQVYSKAGIVEEPHGADGTYATRALSNSAQLPFLDSALSPTYFYRVMQQHLISAYPAITASTQTYDLGCDKRPLYHSFIDAGGIFNIISSPCHDLVQGSNPMQEVLSGNLSIMEVMHSVLDMPNDVLSQPYRLLLPIAQTNGARKHWTLLFITDKAISHYDSTGPRSLHYNLGNVEQAARMISNSPLKYFYLGHQGVVNNKDCGLFVMSYMHALLQNKQVSGMSTESVLAMFANIHSKEKLCAVAFKALEEESGADCSWDGE